MKYLITGTNGQLGYDLVLELKKVNSDLCLTTKEDLDIKNRNLVFEKILKEKPDIIIHTAALTDVLKAEKNYQEAYNVNYLGTKNLLDACKLINSTFVYISTDYVFSGSKDGLYEINDKPNPLNNYGKTKYLGEEIVKQYEKHFIIRVSWLFGINGKNFIKTILSLAKNKEKLTVVSDQVGTPTYTKDLAKSLVLIIKTKKYGIYHITNEGFCSFYDLASYVLKIMNIDIKIEKVLTKDYDNIVKRPLNSKLSKMSLDENGFKRLPIWQDAVLRYLEEITKKGDGE